MEQINEEDLINLLSEEFQNVRVVDSERDIYFKNNFFRNSPIHKNNSWQDLRHQLNKLMIKFFEFESMGQYVQKYGFDGVQSEFKKMLNRQVFIYFEQVFENNEDVQLSGILVSTCLYHFQSVYSYVKSNYDLSVQKQRYDAYMSQQKWLKQNSNVYLLGMCYYMRLDNLQFIVKGLDVNNKYHKQTILGLQGVQWEGIIDKGLSKEEQERLGVIKKAISKDKNKNKDKDEIVKEVQCGNIKCGVHKVCVNIGIQVQVQVKKIKDLNLQEEYFMVMIEVDQIQKF